MVGDPRIGQLLEELLDSGHSPEEVCRDCPELLPQVRERWRRKLACDAQLDAMFPAPESSSPLGGPPATPPTADLPKIPRYEVHEVLGRGGMGVVYRARHVRLNRPVAVKMLLAGAHASPASRKRLLREAEAVAGLRHPNIVQVHDMGDHDGQPYFTMEFVEGGNLARKLAGIPQPARSAADLLATLAHAVQSAHQSGIVHRDLKPANVLLTVDGTPKISDFGLARRLDGEASLTLTGTTVGTPSYMAPEQAEAKPLNWGPAVDIYALGAILYELLTGRPPFQAETAAETVRQVISQDPVPPSRLNGKVPRDLENICLKCLEKRPARRYTSSQDLADDLHRVLDGKPVLARPAGVFDRAVKWARRRPALAMLLVALTVSLAAAVGLGIWLQQQESTRKLAQAVRQRRAREAIETTIDNAYKSGRDERWDEANRILADATNHLPDADSDDLRLRIAQAGADLKFARDIESIRAMIEPRILANFFVQVPSYSKFAGEYAKAFSRANIDVRKNADLAATRIRSNPLAEQITAALEVWAFAEFKQNRTAGQKLLLRIAQLVDPEPAWRDRFRNLAIWRDKQALLWLADDASKAPKPPPAHQLAILGALLRDLREPDEQWRLLRDALDRRPGDFWLNWEMGHALAGDNRNAEAATYLRVVIALRPGFPWAENTLGTILSLAGEFDESVRHLRAGVSQDPADMRCRHNLVLALARAGLFGEAQAECRRNIQANPNNDAPYLTLGALFFERGQIDEAIPVVQKARDLNPGNASLHWSVGVALKSARRYAEALTAFQNAVDIRAMYTNAHDGAGQCLAKLGRHDEAIAEFLWIIRELDPEKTQVNGELVDTPASEYVDARVGMAESLLCLGHFKESGAAIRFALELPTLDASRHQALERLLNISQELAPLETRLPAILGNQYQLADFHARRAFAMWCYQCGRFPATAVRHFEAVFTKEPFLALDRRSEDRFHAACAAALAGNGLGEDAGKLTDQERRALRKKSQEWLGADYAAWLERSAHGSAGDRTIAARAMRAWLQNDDLACVRDRSALAQLPETERADWQSLWADVNEIVNRDPSLTRQQARAQAARKQWAEAAASYVQSLKDEPDGEGEILFELAAVRLLAGDRQGYRQTCERMSSDALNGKIRAYLAARACTLAQHSIADALERMTRLSDRELKSSATAFWSLTEQGAIECRAGRFKEAVPLFRRSLQTSRTGSAVLNWLWLALAYHNLGERQQALRWLEKADAWLDSLGSEVPTNAESTMGLHLHNWLEANILRREATVVLLQSPALRQDR
jgi:eukaryotic-like serine/threonine-protein kinase